MDRLNKDLLSHPSILSLHLGGEFALYDGKRIRMEEARWIGGGADGWLGSFLSIHLHLSSHLNLYLI